MNRPRLLRGSPEERALRTAGLSLVCNLAYALYHGALGVLALSWWFAALAGYYAILSVARFSVLLSSRRRGGRDMEPGSAGRAAGLLLMLLSAALGGSVLLTLTDHTEAPRNTIVMITIAAYTFTKLTLAVVNSVRACRRRSALLRALRGVSCADAAASLLALQRAMLATFPGMSPREVLWMNGGTGGAVCLFIFAAGAVLAQRRPFESKEMPPHGKI